MKVDQYRYRNIRRYVTECFRRGECRICAPPEGTYFDWERIKNIEWIGLYWTSGKTNYKNRIIMVAHNHTKNNDIWIAPFDATKPETIDNRYIKIIRDRLENLVL